MTIYWMHLLGMYKQGANRRQQKSADMRWVTRRHQARHARQGACNDKLFADSQDSVGDVFKKRNKQQTTKTQN